MEKYFSISIMVLVSLTAIGFTGYVYGQNTTIPDNNGGEAFVNSLWGLFLAVGAIFGTISLIAIKVATNIKERLKNSTNENHKKIVSIIDDYVLPILQTGNEFVDKTKNQEEKLKEFGNIIYDFMGPEADKITEKPKVQIVKLEQDVTKANVQAEEYAKKLERLMAIMNELKGEPEKTMGQAKAQAPPVFNK
jgi:hypothetical protein